MQTEEISNARFCFSYLPEIYASNLRSRSHTVGKTDMAVKIMKTCVAVYFKPPILRLALGKIADKLSPSRIRYSTQAACSNLET
jgi:hypothetical protein